MSTRVQTVVGQAVLYHLDLSLKRSLEGTRNSWAEKDFNLSTYFYGKGVFWILSPFSCLPLG